MALQTGMVDVTSFLRGGVQAGGVPGSFNHEVYMVASLPVMLLARVCHFMVAQSMVQGLYMFTPRGSFPRMQPAASLFWHCAPAWF